jgi:hypothetical protein
VEVGKIRMASTLGESEEFESLDCLQKSSRYQLFAWELFFVFKLTGYILWRLAFD